MHSVASRTINITLSCKGAKEMHGCTLAYRPTLRG